VNTRGRLISGLVTTVMALAGFMTAGTLPAAATASTVQYVALGDSYAAGVGAGNPNPDCGRSGAGYPELLDDQGRIELLANFACFGATTSDVAKTVSELKKLGKLNPDTRLVTLTIGGADLNFRAVLTTCTVDKDACKTAIDNAVTPNLEKLGDNLTSLYAQIADAAPEARIVVTGYPLLFRDVEDPEGFSLEPVINPVNKAGAALNETIEQAVAAANEDGNIDYVDVTEEFQEHGVLLRVNNTSATHPADLSAFIHSPFIICDPTTDLECKDPGDPAAYHPTDDGYDAYADAISAALPRGWLNKQD
jgi:lysophospholipase L1-like esterase